MNYLFNIILNFVDFFYQKKIINYFKQNIGTNIKLLLDVGAHKGETIKIFLKNFNIEKIYSFEASKLNYEELISNTKKIKKKFINLDLKTFNIGIGSSSDSKIFYDLSDSNSSTFNKININSKYFKKKDKILSFFSKKKFFFKEYSLQQVRLFEFIVEHKLGEIDILKIDTEGYEFEVLKGLGDKILSVKFIYFEHHYDNMIEKNYKFSDIHDLLKNKGFIQSFKIKMPLRKSFDYIYKKNI